MYSRLPINILLLFFITIMSAQIQNPKNIPFTWKTDLSKSSVNLSEIQIVLPKGSFPTLDQPVFEGKDVGLNMFYKREPVIAVEIDGLAKAYSLNILTMHEIANDELGGKQILVTYCPLCNSGIVYNRVLKVNGENEILEFEASGMLRNSDMVMIDRSTESLWQQLLGTSIAGDYNEVELEIIPSLIISVEEFFNLYPEGKILSKNTGFAGAESRYGFNPYTNYDKSDAPYERFFDSELVDKRLPAMERVVDIENIGDYKIYSFTSVSEKGVINDIFKEKKVVLFFKEGTISIMDQNDITKSRDVGSVTVFNSVLDGQHLTFKKESDYFTDNETGSKWDISGRCISGDLQGKKLEIEPHSNHFAFAWLAFHPDSQIYSDLD